MFFECEESLFSRKIPKETRGEIEAIFKRNEIYKKLRMKYLLNKETLNTLDWIEWFNWYYTINANKKEPLWLESYRKSHTKQSDIEYLNYDKLIKLGWSVKDIVYSSVSLSEKGIHKYHANDSDIDYWVKLRNRSPNLFSGAFLAGQLIGQAGFIEIGKNDFIKMKSGYITENQISCNKTIEEKSKYLYIPSVVLQERWKKKFVLYKILKNLKSQIEKSEIDIEKTKLIAITYSQEGTDLCVRLDFNLESYRNNGDIIFTANLKDFMTKI